MHLGNNLRGVGAAFDFSTPSSFNITAPDTTAPVASSATSSPSWISEIIGGISSAYTTYTQAQLAKKLADINLQRAQAGQAPLNMSQYGPQYGVNVGLAAPTQNLLMYGGIGLLAVLLVTRMGKGKSRR